MKIEDSIVKAYLEKKPSSEYSNHWIFSNVISDTNVFIEPPFERTTEVENCQKQLVKLYDNFILRNENLIHNVFHDAPAIVENANILHTVGLPWPYTALMRTHKDVDYIVFDLIHFSDGILKGTDISAMVSNLLSHELIHVIINANYRHSYKQDYSYREMLDFISFHEGFAHLLSYKENIENYQPDDKYKARFFEAKGKLALALSEKNSALQKQYLLESNTGEYWSKFAAASSMIYLMKNIGSLREVYEAGWKGYAQSIIDFAWA